LTRAPRGIPKSLGGFLDFEPRTADFRAAVLEGLVRERKRVPPKFFYDEAGSALFERICALPEYYPTRTEIALLRDFGPDIAARCDAGANVVEFGSGSNVKARILLEALRSPAAYVPVDISRDHLLASAAELATALPSLAVIPVCADFTRPFELPRTSARGQRLGFFPGSSIGNFQPLEAAAFLRRARSILGPDSAFVVGVDLKKDARILNAAYDDAAGVTAAFNRNLLVRMNRELGAGIDVASFDHRAFYNDRRGCVEMHLVSRVDQTIRISGRAFAFSAGESIHTEDSFKYTVPEFATLAAANGWRPDGVWVDEGQLFSIHYLVPD
jgi:dimethylhistidine N-methyltransferase